LRFFAINVILYRLKSEIMKDNKQSLLYVITKSELGGAQASVYDLIYNFHQIYDIHLATGSEGLLTEKASSLGVSVHTIPNLTRDIHLFRDYLAVKECIQLINEIQPNIIHVHSSKAGVVARIAAWISKLPVVFTAHGWGFSPGTPKFRRIVALVAEKLLALFSSKIICVSENDRLLAKKSSVGNQDLLQVVRYGISNIPQTFANPSTQPPRLIMVARFNEQKDQTSLLQAIAQLQKYPIHLDLVGSGPFLESCKALAKFLGIEDRVSFLGDRTDVADLLAQYQIFILSTHYEGLPISILEAMRAGLPVVATKVNGIPEEVIDGETGLLVPRQDVSALRTALAVLIQSPNLRQQMGEAGRQKFEREFTVERMINETKAVYDKALEERKIK
jgi:glycosyltransferase involved in cell wall biosynthesis